jgi:hypothetical protein
MPKSRGRKPPKTPKGQSTTKELKGQSTPKAPKGQPVPYAPRTAKRAIDTPRPTPKMVEMAAKKTIVEEIVRSPY